MNSQRNSLDQIRDSDPNTLLLTVYGARFASGSKETHKARQYILSDGRRVGTKEATKGGGYLWVVDNERSRGGRGCINLVRELNSCTVGEAIQLLSPAHSAWNSARGHAATPIATLAGPTERLLVPKPNSHRWPRVRAWLIEERGLPSRLVDHLYAQKLTYADERTNAVFIRVRGGAFVRGTGVAKFHRAVGGQGCGPFVIAGDQHLVLCESAIDACSIKAMAPHAHVVGLGGSMFSANDALAHLPLDRRVVLAFDADDAGRAFTEEALLVWHNAAVRIPTTGKDWNDTIRAEPHRAARHWL